MLVNLINNCFIWFPCIDIEAHFLSKQSNRVRNGMQSVMMAFPGHTHLLLVFSIEVC